MQRYASCTYGRLIWYRGLISLKWSLFSISVVSRPVCVGEIVIFVRYATAILNCPTLVFKSPIMCSLNPSPKRIAHAQMIYVFSKCWTRSLVQSWTNKGDCIVANAITYLNCVSGAGSYKCCKIFYTILCSVYVIICMRALNVSPIPKISTMCPYDCKLNMIRVMLYPKSVYCMTVTRPPISSYHHPPFAMKSPHTMADGSKSIRPVLCRSLFWFRQECQARRLWSSWTAIKEERERERIGHFQYFRRVFSNWIILISIFRLARDVAHVLNYNNGIDCHVFEKNKGKKQQISRLFVFFILILRKIITTMIIYVGLDSCDLNHISKFF